jgi:hypothetical protein
MLPVPAQVRVYDRTTGQYAWCEVTARPTPAGPQRNCFATKKGELWTLQLRLEHNGAKIGQLVADLAKPSISSLWDIKVRVCRPSLRDLHACAPGLSMRAHPENV